MTAEMERAVEPGARDRIRILIVEDDFGDVVLVKEALKESNLKYDLEHVTDGEEAIQRLTGRTRMDSGGAPDLVLLDINLPKRDGWEVLEELRMDPAAQDTPVVILTASGMPRDRVRAGGNTRSMYIQKPASLDDFLAIGKRIEAFWRESRAGG